MVRAGVEGMHSETLTYEREAPYFHSIPSAVWWRVPGEGGIVLHSLSWAPLLLDFAVVEAHDTSTLENWTIDGDYAFKNLGSAAKVHVVQDSDEMFLCSWGPLADRAFDLKPRFNHRFNWVNSLSKGRELNAAFYGPYFDPLKRRFFFLPVYWHADALNDKWYQTERKAQTIILHATSTRVNAAGAWLNATSAWLGLFSRVTHIACEFWRYRQNIAARFRELVSGDRRAWTRISWRVRQTAIFLLNGRE